MGKYAPFFLIPPRETGEAAVGRRRRPIRPLRATAASGNKGERERGGAWEWFPASPRAGVSRRGGSTGTAAAEGWSCGGGPAARKGELWLASGVVGMASYAGCPFIGAIGR